MTKTFTFNTKKNNNYNTTFYSKSMYTPRDYSKIIDDIILTDVINKNSYLFNNNPIILGSSILKDDNEFIKAANFLSKYKSYKKSNKLPYIFGKMYTLSDGTRIVFYDDEIQIGANFYKYSDFSDMSFLNDITDNTKKIIINIYTNGAANININLL